MVFLLTTVWTDITDLCTFLPFAPCTLHSAVNWFCVIVLCYNGWPAKMGFMPFWQPSTLCFDAVSFHSCTVVSWRINLSLSLSLSAIFTTGCFGCCDARSDQPMHWQQAPLTGINRFPLQASTGDPYRHQQCTVGCSVASTLRRESPDINLGPVALSMFMIYHPDICQHNCCFVLFHMVKMQSNDGSWASNTFGGLSPPRLAGRATRNVIDVLMPLVTTATADLYIITFHYINPLSVCPLPHSRTTAWTQTGLGAW